VEFHFKNKFEKLVHLVGFIIQLYGTSVGVMKLVSYFEGRTDILGV
jgi:hypothetical protein